MIDESLLKSNFIGRDGFRWWIGQIPPIDAQGGQAGGSGWGNRTKVRILGYHPYSEKELPNEDLPWAQVLIPTTSGSGAANVATDVKLQPGDTVFGFFLDGDNAQIPVVMSTFGRTSQVPSVDYQSPFIPFTGYSSQIKEPNGGVQKNESNEQNSGSQKSPRTVSPAQAKSLQNGEISYFSAIGDKVQLASASKGSVVNKISTEIGNLVSRVQNLTADITNTTSQIQQIINREIDIIVGKVQSIISGLVTNMINKLFRTLAPLFNKGLKLLYDLVYRLVLAATKCAPCAHLAGVAAQKAMVGPIKAIQNTIPCISNNIINGLGGIIKSALQGVVDNVQRFVACAANQFTGALVNDIIGNIAGAMSGLIGAVGPILQFFGGFSIEGTLRGAVDGLSGGAPSLACGQRPSGGSGVTQWVIGQGPINVPPTPFDQILNNANVAASLATGALNGFDIFNSGTRNPGTITPLGGCFTGPPVICSPPTVNVFGGGGQGCTATPILGAYVGSGRDATASIIGVRVTNPGSGYEYPPFVEIYDECGRGYGAQARSIIDDNGRVTEIYLISEGENYVVRDTPNYILGGVSVIDPGSGYEDGDEGVDDFGNRYRVTVNNGFVAEARPLNIIRVNDAPEIRVRSITGSGAILKPVLFDEDQFQGELVNVVDCILK
jgi:hypothetical protein